MNRKRKINYNPESNSEGSGASAAAEVAATLPTANHWDEISKDAGLGTGSDTTEDSNAEVVENADASSAKTAEEIADEKAAAESGNAAEESATDETDKLEAPEVADIPEPIEETFGQVAIDIGFTPPKDPNNYAEFVANGKAAIDAAREEGRKEASKPDPEKYGPAATQFIEALNGGMPFEKILAPLVAFDEVMVLPAKELIALNWKNNEGYTDDMVADKMAILEQTPGLIDLEGGKLRKALEVAKATRYNEIVGTYQSAYKAEQTKQADKLKAENEAVLAEIRSRKEYMGAPLEPNVIENIAKNWENGTYKKLLENPKAVTDLILTNLYLQKRMAALLKKKDTDTKTAVSKKLANTNLGESATSHTEKNSALINPNDHFANIEQEMKDAKFEGVQYGQRR